MCRPLINMESIDKIERHIADAVERGAKVVTGGKRHALGRSFFEPTVLAHVSADLLVVQEETSGPLAPVIRFRDEWRGSELCDLMATSPCLPIAYWGSGGSVVLSPKTLAAVRVNGSCSRPCPRTGGRGAFREAASPRIADTNMISTTQRVKMD